MSVSGAGQPGRGTRQNMAMSGSGQSSVGNRSVYESGDQRNVPVSELKERARYAEGMPTSHNNLDSKDGRSIANKLASQENKPDSSHHHHNEYDAEAEMSKQNPTKPAEQHGNAPSKGARIDADLKADDEQRLQEKGIKH
ncbi:hypothetical protein N7519_005999 [Penicillium mononematosum]|uniref:uncharacterized protein n=1 Tax=Penicillium mononematosum TaxID=268346 RepID=UPI002548D9EB|nr:uncharacterized protein N7519_005999 [Penicillium mononematosum]KAJ6184698.1 hypothetical protein N7519_005999 [Penicillium mononematosum]